MIGHTTYRDTRNDAHSEMKGAEMPEIQGYEEEIAGCRQTGALPT